jgi:hypothetical protein
MLGDLTFFQRFFLSVGGGEAQQLKIRLGQMIAGYRLMDCAKNSGPKPKRLFQPAKVSVVGLLSSAQLENKHRQNFPANGSNNTHHTHFHHH